MSTLPEDEKEMRRLKRRIKELEVAILNFRLCPGAKPANAPNGPNIGGLCETCQSEAKRLLK